jgi:hypothetical protein
MRPAVYTVTGTQTSNVYAPDQYTSPFNVALSVLVTGTVDYTVQYTFDNVFASNYVPASGNWVDHPSLTAQTTTKDSNIAYPVQGIRIKCNSGAGTARFTIIQAGGGGKA